MVFESTVLMLTYFENLKANKSNHNNKKKDEKSKKTASKRNNQINSISEQIINYEDIFKTNK